jgi:pimeloyl-ACP methyl ester carboxylesterase
MNASRFPVLLAPLAAALLALGCAKQPPNPSFNVSNDDAKAALREMRRDAKPLPRPLVVLGGLQDPGIAVSVLCDDFRRLSGDDPRVIGVSFFFAGNFDNCRKRVIDAVDEAFPSDDPVWTTEVDVVAVSMGGLVARYAAAAPAPEEARASAAPDQTPTTTGAETEPPKASSGAPARRLRIARLFTISSPHRGAALAFLPTLNPLQIDMRAGSKFLRRLDACDGLAADDASLAQTRPSTGYELIPYVRLNDMIVGESNAAPTGWTPRWVPAEPFQDSHLFAIADPRIVADIARRLRGEPPLTTDPPAPLPAQ